MYERGFIDKLKEYAKAHEKDSRYKHTEGVVAESVRLAEKYGVAVDKAEVAAWFHDCFKEKGNIEHGPYAAEILKKDFGIDDEDILNALRYHTVGRPGMSKLEMVLYVADSIEPGRTYPQAEEYRKLEKETNSLVKVCYEILSRTIKYVSQMGPFIDEHSIQAKAWFEQEYKGEL